MGSHRLLELDAQQHFLLLPLHHRLRRLHQPSFQRSRLGVPDVSREEAQRGVRKVDSSKPGEHREEHHADGPYPFDRLLRG